MKNNIEVFAIAISNGKGYYDASKVDISNKTQDPNNLAEEIVEKYLFYSKDGFFLHSTSWRYLESSNSIYLTYIACSRKFDKSRLSKSISVESSETYYTRENISEVSVLSHGIRHLVFLFRQEHFQNHEQYVDAQDFESLMSKFELGGRI